MGQSRSAGRGWSSVAGALMAALAVVWCPSMAAAEIEEFIPQGRVSGVEAVQLRFGDAVAAFGDTDATAPMLLECEGPVPEGRGRWLDDHRWAYVFKRPVPAGVQCVARLNPRFRPLDGKLPSAREYMFDTGAPAVAESRPYAGWDVDEEQAFVLRFSGPVDPRQVAGQSHCVVEGVAERIPVRAVSAADQRSLMQAAMLEAPDDPATIAVLQCARSLPAGGEMRMEVGPGIRAVGQAAALAGSEAPHVLAYKVRPAFTVKLSCARERAGRPCLPVSPISVSFSAPVPRQFIEQVSLRAGDRVFQPEIDEDDPGFVSFLRYPGPFPAGASLVLSLPEGLRDDAGRPLINADQYPLTVPLADYPPLVKFASGTFGVIERFAHAPADDGDVPPPAVPVTLRHVEADATVRSADWSAGKVADLHTVEDGDVLRWYARLQRMEGGTWSDAQFQDILAGRAPRDDYASDVPRRDVRSLSLLKSHEAVRRLRLPGAPGDGLRPFEVVGIPLQEPGFHVLEIESPRLGASLLEDGRPMYVRTGVLLTNLSLHVKQGQDDLLVWVTTLAQAEPVAGAELRVLDCKGRPLARGTTDDEGLWHHRAPVDAPDYCPETGLGGLFVSARIPAGHPQAHGAADYAFVLSGWDRGIEAWRFNVPTSDSATPHRLAHTVFDRTLLRAGETVSMKHFLREETRDGLRVPADGRPDRVVIEHEGSSQRHEMPLTWQETASGGLVALGEFAIPEAAPLGAYAVRLTDAEESWYGSSRFRVEEFRLPILTGQLDVKGGTVPHALVAPDTLDVSMQLTWLSGGPAAGQRVTLRAVAEDRYPQFDGYEDYGFQPPPRALDSGDDALDTPAPDSAQDSGQGRQLFVDGHDFVLDANGMAAVSVDAPPALDRPQRFQLEASFADPGGEIQTISRSVDVWAASIQAGLKAESWGRVDRDIPVSLIALGLDGRPQAGVAMQLQVVERKMYSVRKRMVGGFYRYESRTERHDLGTFCDGHTGAAGTLSCQIRLPREGNFELVAVAHDSHGLRSRAYATIWLSGAGELWFGGGDDDRIDLIPARREWKAGEEAEFQVRMPFREATALVTVEREGVLWKKRVRLEGRNPVVKVPVSADWGPNAYVSALVLRGRLYGVPWRSFLQWGWRQPAQWLEAYRENPDDTLVTQRVDLAKPAFRLGVSEIRIAGSSDRLDVTVAPDRAIAQVKEEVSVALRVRLPDGSPAAHGTVAFAVVDEALLELAPNESWKLYEAMHPRRSLSVRTATTQLEVVGRRHYGRKAVAAGGGGGSVPTRQLFDTLLSWQPQVQLDANGEAQVRFRLNDALSRFRLVAIADHGAGNFGVAETSIVTRQDLQLVSGLPPVVREGDRYRAQFTVRNATAEERDIRVSAVRTAGGKEEQLPERTLRLAGGESAAVSWDVSVAALPWPQEVAELGWRVEAGDGSVTDRILVSQRVEPATPTATVQAALRGVPAGQAVSVPLAPPVHAMRGAAGDVFGGVVLDVSASLAGSLQGVLDWWEQYPYTCLEQTASQAIALADPQRWSKVVGRLATYMDDDGLLRYFPGTGPGSEVLTAYLLSVHAEAQRLGVAFDLPPHARQRMLDGLQAFALGQIRRDAARSVGSLDARRIMALEALARHGRVTPAMLTSFAQSPSEWATPTVVDWLSLLLRMPEAASREKQIAQARGLLISRMSVSGGAMTFSDGPSSSASGLMATGVTSLARLMLAVMERPEWQDDLPRMAQGLLAAQSRGAWAITTENLLGMLALRSFAQHFEAVPAEGVVHASIAPHQAVELVSHRAAELAPGHAAELAVGPGSVSTARLGWPRQEAVLELEHIGKGTAWVGMRAQARVPAEAAQDAGFRITRRVVPVLRAGDSNGWSRGDVYRVELEIHAWESAGWVVLVDPVPAGATILGSGLGRDSRSHVEAAAEDWQPAYEERTATAYRAYFDYLPAGRVGVSYTVRLNAIGSFALPPTRVEALYRPDLYGIHPNEAGMSVEPGAFDAAAR